jgi:hypothetical protein
MHVGGVFLHFMVLSRGACIHAWGALCHLICPLLFSDGVEPFCLTSRSRNFGAFCLCCVEPLPFPYGTGKCSLK